MTSNQEKNIKDIIKDLRLHEGKSKKQVLIDQINLRLKQSLKSYYEDISLISKDILIHSETNPDKTMKKLIK